MIFCAQKNIFLFFLTENVNIYFFFARILCFEKKKFDSKVKIRLNHLDGWIGRRTVSMAGFVGPILTILGADSKDRWIT